MHTKNLFSTVGEKKTAVGTGQPSTHQPLSISNEQGKKDVELSL